MPRKYVEPEVLDPTTTPLIDQEVIDHIHDLDGNCLKHRYGPRCGASGRPTRLFTGSV